MATDWGATGAMLLGIGTCGGAIAVTYAARVGRTAFKDWRRQKIEEIKIDRAERIMSAIYEAETCLGYVRGPFIPAYELGRAEGLLSEAGIDVKSRSEAESSRLRVSQAILSRTNDHGDIWKELEACRPAAKALFGEHVEKALESLLRQLQIIRVAADMYSQHGADEGDFPQKLRADMWGITEADKVGDAIKSAVADAEAVLLPVIRSTP